jgi:DNA-directed RNA polymerase specialized sigma24 family protein
MLASFLLSLREGLEAALIIGIVIGSLQHMRRTELKRVVWLGVLCAVLLSLVGATALNLAGMEFGGRAEELIELSERKRRVHAALVELPDAQKIPLAYAYFHGYSHREIA